MSQEMLDRILNAVVDLKVNMDIKFEQVNDRFNGIDLRFDRVEERLTNVEMRLDSVERRIEKVETELGYVKTAVLETGRAVKGHDERIVVLEGRN